MYYYKSYTAIQNILLRGDNLNLLIDDIPINLQQMVDIIGMEKLVQLSKIYGGASLYIPMYKTLLIRDRNRKIVKQFNGKNGDFLRKKYNISYAQLRLLIKTG